MNKSLCCEINLDMDYDEAVEKVTVALKQEGFGVLTRIDVKHTLKEKLDADFRPYAILGACNPPLAHKALSKDAVAGLLLPCNVTVEAAPTGSGSIVRIVNPSAMMDAGMLADNDVLLEVSEEAQMKLERVAAALQT